MAIFNTCLILHVDIVVCAGLQQIVFNFGAVQDKISGPVAIVNVGAEVARTDLSGLYQFAALVNLNLAVCDKPHVMSCAFPCSLGSFAC